MVSALSSHGHETNLFAMAQKTVLFLGRIFTFFAITYSTTRGPTQSRALVGKGKTGRIQLSDGDEHHSELGIVQSILNLAGVTPLPSIA